MDDQKIILCKSKKCRIKSTCSRHHLNNSNNPWLTGIRNELVDYFKEKEICGFYISTIN